VQQLELRSRVVSFLSFVSYFWSHLFAVKQVLRFAVALRHQLQEHILLPSLNVSTVSAVISMIRLPPTSISLSESDINLHLREISIYQSLLQQGFTREAIQVYYASIRAPEPEGHPSSQRPQLTSTRKASSDVEKPITHEDQPAQFHNPDQQTSQPALPIGESGEVARSANEVRQMRKNRATQAAPRTAEYVELHSKTTVDISKQPTCEEASEEPSSADTDTEVVKMSTSRATGCFAPSIVELRAGARLGSECFPPLVHDLSDDYGGMLPALRLAHLYGFAYT
jgi:hypothetical protein